MTLTAIKYARVLWELNMPVEEMEEARELYHIIPQVQEALESPIVYNENKHAVIDRMFPEKIRKFMKILCDYSDMEYFDEIVDAYKAYVNEHNHLLSAQLRYVNEPDEKQLEKIRQFLSDRYHADKVELETIKDDSLIGGFILLAEGQEYDWSLRGRIANLQDTLNRR